MAEGLGRRRGGLKVEAGMAGRWGRRGGAVNEQSLPEYTVTWPESLCHTVLHLQLEQHSFCKSVSVQQ